MIIEMIIIAHEKVNEKDLKKNMSSKKREEEILGEFGSVETIKKKRK